MKARALSGSVRLTTIIAVAAPLTALLGAVGRW